MPKKGECPNCGSDLKSGLISSNHLFSDEETQLINEYHEYKSEAYCSNCGKDLYNKYFAEYRNEKKQLTIILKKLISAIPVISAHSPLNWEYNVLDMVTGQSTTGTGVISEFTSSFTDLLGAQSGRHNKKLKAGEDFCFSQIRKFTLDSGGNAVIATDIDYSELGAGKGMIMVCMSGTAVKLKNLEVIGQERATKIKKLISAHERLSYLNTIVVDRY